MPHRFLKSKKRVSKALKKKSSKKNNKLMRKKKMVGGCKITLGLQTKQTQKNSFGKTEYITQIVGFTIETDALLKYLIDNMNDHPINNKMIILTEKKKDGTEKQIGILNNKGRNGRTPRIDLNIKDILTKIQENDPQSTYTLDIFDFKGDGDCEDSDIGISVEEASLENVSSALEMKYGVRTPAPSVEHNDNPGRTQSFSRQDPRRAHVIKRGRSVNPAPAPSPSPAPSAEENPVYEPVANRHTTQTLYQLVNDPEENPYSVSSRYKGVKAASKQSVYNHLGPRTQGEVYHHLHGVTPKNNEGEYAVLRR